MPNLELVAAMAVRARSTGSWPQVVSQLHKKTSGLLVQKAWAQEPSFANVGDGVILSNFNSTYSLNYLHLWFYLEHELLSKLMVGLVAMEAVIGLIEMRGKITGEARRSVTSPPPTHSMVRICSFT